MKNRKWESEEKMSVVMEMLKGDQTVAQICRSHGVSEALAYKWRDDALSAMQERLSGGHKQNGGSTNQGEIDRLLKVIGQQAYAIDCQKKFLRGASL